MSQQWNPLQDLVLLQDRMNRLFEDATQRRNQSDAGASDEFERADWTPTPLAGVAGRAVLAA